MLMLASRTHRRPAANHSTGERGIATSAMDASKAPGRKYGRRRPSELQVRSESWRLIGCTISPVRGAAAHRVGRSSIEAPSVWKMRLMFEFCSWKANWIPRNPKHMFQICQKETCGFAADAAMFIRRRTLVASSSETAWVKSAGHDGQ